MLTNHSSQVIDHLTSHLAHDGSVVCFYYFDCSDIETQPLNILANLLRQVLQGLETLPPCVGDAHAKHPNMRLPDLEELMDSSIKCVDNVYLVI
jgi:hypothetical protein